MTPEDPAYLRHILDAINHIEDFSKSISSAADLKASPLERAGIERMLTIIGEAAKNVSPKLRKKYSEIPWKATAGMRDKIIHHYFGVDYEAVFETLKNDLPVLKQGISAVLDEMDTTKKADVVRKNKSRAGRKKKT